MPSRMAVSPADDLPQPFLQILAFHLASCPSIDNRVTSDLYVGPHLTGSGGADQNARRGVPGLHYIYIDGGEGEP